MRLFGGGRRRTFGHGKELGTYRNDLYERTQRIDARLEASEGLLQVTRELRALNDSLNAVAYAALGQSPQVRRRAG